MHPREIAIVGVLVLLVLVPWLIVRDLWSHSARRWSAAGRSRWAWTLVVVVVPVLGPAWYLRVVRPGLRDRGPTGRGDVTNP